MRYELTDEEWTVIKPMLPNKPRGTPRVNDRRVLNGIFRVLRSGAPWRDLPDIFGPYTTCYNRFVRWRRAGVRAKIMSALAGTHERRGANDRYVYCSRASARGVHHTKPDSNACFAAGHGALIHQAADLPSGEQVLFPAELTDLPIKLRTLVQLSVLRPAASVAGTKSAAVAHLVSGEFCCMQSSIPI
jgi:transposase